MFYAGGRGFVTGKDFAQFQQSAAAQFRPSDAAGVKDDAGMASPAQAAGPLAGLGCRLTVSKGQR